jgi:hypothetical protein
LPAHLSKVDAEPPTLFVDCESLDDGRLRAAVAVSVDVLVFLGSPRLAFIYIAAAALVVFTHFEGSITLDWLLLLFPLLLVPLP